LSISKSATSNAASSLEDVLLALRFQESELCGHDVPNAGKVLEQSGGTDSRAHGAARHGEEEDRAAAQQDVAQVKQQLVFRAGSVSGIALCFGESEIRIANVRAAAK